MNFTGVPPALTWVRVMIEEKMTGFKAPPGIWAIVSKNLTLSFGANSLWVGEHD